MTGLRWSSARDCGRKACYETLTEPDREHTDREQRIFWRGRSLGADYAEWLKAKFGPRTVFREVKVKWAHGVGHIDIYLRPLRLAVEVLSSAFASDAMVRSKLLQLVLYMENYPRAESGMVVVLNPSDFSEERWPLVRDSDTYRELVEEADRRIAELDKWRDTGELPARVCRRPSDAAGHFCRFADTCFAGWEPPDPEAVLTSVEALHLATRLSRAKDAERAAKVVVAEAEDERRDIEAELAELDGVAGVQGDIHIGPWVVKRTFVQRRPSLNVKKAEMAGLLNPELLAEFYKPGASYWTTGIARGDVAQETESARLERYALDVPWPDGDLAA